ncbi:MAG: hypothetical protein LBF59_02620 [Prevotellaceae bacterium]|jgi:hypothetical protein|nr:hypothetical protein [Prevotellaceae bacterium]
MKQLKKSVLFFIFLALIVIQGSSRDDYYDYYDYYAVYMNRDDLKKSISYKSGTEQEMKNPGKIYYKHPYLYVNEKYKGVHVFDNTDAKLEKKGFIVAPGCLDMAVKGDIIYLDNAVDLVSFNLKTLKETKRIENVFPEPVAPNGIVRYDYERPENFVVVEWVKRY